MKLAKKVYLLITKEKRRRRRRRRKKKYRRGNNGVVEKLFERRYSERRLHFFLFHFSICVFSCIFFCCILVGRERRSTREAIKQQRVNSRYCWIYTFAFLFANQPKLFESISFCKLLPRSSIENQLRLPSDCESKLTTD